MKNRAKSVGRRRSRKQGSVAPRRGRANQARAPRADPRFSSVTDLGALRQTYRQPEPSFIISFGFLAGALLVLILLDESRRTPSAFGLALLLGLPLAFAAVLWRSWRRSRAVVALFEGGFAFHDGEELVPVRWEEIDALESIGLYSGGFYHDVVARGLRLKLPWTLDGIDELWSELKENALVEAVSISWKGQRQTEGR